MAGGLGAGIISLAIPANQQGSGSYSLTTEPEDGFYSGSTMCNGPSSTSSGGCILSATSTTGDTAAGQVLSYSDSAGLHILTSVSTAGYAQASGQASDIFYDEVTNNSSSTANFAITFHVDATLTSNPNGSTLLGIEVGQNYPSCFAASLCPYEYNVLQTWNYREANDNSTSLNQDFVTNAFTLGAGQSTVFVLYMSASSVAFNGGTAATNAQNTLTITGFTGTDMYGDALPASDFSSADGANYSTIDTTSQASAPEPGTGILLLPLCAGLLVVAFRRRSGAR
jgi:hypothetical protein